MYKYDLLFAGDTFLATCEKDKEKSPFSPSVEALFKESRHICINLETTIGEDGTKVNKAFNFQQSPDALQSLIKNNIRICSLANNHSNDYGEDGLKETIRNLRLNELDYIGITACNQKDVSVCGARIRLCAYYGNEKGIAIASLTKIVKDIEQHKKTADHVIVILHWGDEYVAYPSPQQQQMAHTIIDAGASAVIGHHPHVMQGYESYHGGHIFYSLGNFNLFVDHPYAKRLDETTKAYCVGFTLSTDKALNYMIIPISINENWQPEVITEMKEVSRFREYIDAISHPLKGTITRGYYLAKVSPCHFNNHFPSWLKRIKNYGPGQTLPMLRWLLHPRTYKYYLGTIMSLFYKRIKY